jgi:hypothetical protein
MTFSEIEFCDWPYLVIVTFALASDSPLLMLSLTTGAQEPLDYFRNLQLSHKLSILEASLGAKSRSKVAAAKGFAVLSHPMLVKMF